MERCAPIGGALRPYRWSVAPLLVEHCAHIWWSVAPLLVERCAPGRTIIATILVYRFVYTGTQRMFFFYYSSIYRISYIYIYIYITIAAAQMGALRTRAHHHCALVNRKIYKQKPLDIDIY